VWRAASRVGGPPLSPAEVKQYRLPPTPPLRGPSHGLRHCVVLGPHKGVYSTNNYEIDIFPLVAGHPYARATHWETETEPRASLATIEHEARRARNASSMLPLPPPELERPIQAQQFIHYKNGKEIAMPVRPFTEDEYRQVLEAEVADAEHAVLNAKEKAYNREYEHKSALEAAAWRASENKKAERNRQCELRNSPAAVDGRRDVAVGAMLCALLCALIMLAASAMPDAVTVFFTHATGRILQQRVNPQFFWAIFALAFVCSHRRFSCE